MAGRPNRRDPEEKAAERAAATRQAVEIYTPANLPAVKRSREDHGRFSPEAKAEAINEILDRIVNGQSLTRICNLEHLPAAVTFIEWLGASHDTAQRYVRAREIAAEMFAMDIVAISDDEGIDPNSRKVRVDARKWVASRLLPKIYGDKIEVIETGKTVPSSRIMDLVQVSDGAADDMLMIEHDEAQPLTIDQPAAQAEPSADPVEQKKTAGV